MILHCGHNAINVVSERVFVVKAQCFSLLSSLTSFVFVKTLKIVPPNIDVFLQSLSLWGKIDLTKGYGNPKRKMWVTTHFSEIIKQP